MAQIATVAALTGTGTAFAVNAQGVSRALKAGDVLQKGETIRTVGDVQVELLMDDGSLLAVAPNQVLRLDENVSESDQRPTAQDSAVTAPGATAETILQALERGTDLSTELEAPAAGLGGGGAGADGGISFVQLLRIVEGVEPLSYAYSFEPQDSIFIPNEIPLAEVVNETFTITVTGEVTSTVTGMVTDTITGVVTDTITGIVTDTVSGIVTDTVSSEQTITVTATTPTVTEGTQTVTGTAETETVTQGTDTVTGTATTPTVTEGTQTVTGTAETETVTTTEFTASITAGGPTEVLLAVADPITVKFTSPDGKVNTNNGYIGVNNLHIDEADQNSVAERLVVDFLNGTDSTKVTSLQLNISVSGSSATFDWKTSSGNSGTITTAGGLVSIPGEFDKLTITAVSGKFSLGTVVGVSTEVEITTMTPTVTEGTQIVTGTAETETVTQGTETVTGTGMTPTVTEGTQTVGVETETVTSDTLTVNGPTETVTITEFTETVSVTEFTETITVSQFTDTVTVSQFTETVTETFTETATTTDQGLTTEEPQSFQALLANDILPEADNAPVDGAAVTQVNTSGIEPLSFDPVAQESVNRLLTPDGNPIA